MVAEVRAKDRAAREEVFRIHEAMRGASISLQSEADLDALMERVGDARFVLLGEASHGTSEYYTWRMRISQRLIREKGFDFLAVEGDWPECWRVNRYVKGHGDVGESAFDVLNAVERWPTWMWANREVVHLAEWLHRHNQSVSEGQRVGFFGLDVYSLWESMDAVIEYLRHNAPDALEQAVQAYGCFEPYGRDERRYAREVSMVPRSCEAEVVSVLRDLRLRGARRGDDPEEDFAAEQNAVIAVNAERYYRTMMRADDDSWNLRDTHMADTLDRLVDFHLRTRGSAKAIVWAHNTHLGDARATEMAAEGLLNLGQLVRERHERDGVVIVGFGAYQGHVIAARSWGGALETMRVPAAAEGSWDQVLHEGHTPDHGRLIMLDRVAHASSFRRPRGQRAIGVVYHGQRERPGNYVPTVLPERYDALVYFENSRALHPLHAERPRGWEIPETYPSGV